MNQVTTDIGQKLWNLCNLLRDDEVITDCIERQTLRTTLAAMSALTFCTPAARLRAGARELHTSLGNLCVISTEGLIGFKLQGLVNDARRTHDLEDIRSLLRAN